LYFGLMFAFMVLIDLYDLIATQIGD
jgi:hypothetical protein